jgi:hypothetical protein
MAGSRRVTATVSAEIEWLQTAHDWPGLKAIGNWRLDVVMNEDQDRTRLGNGPHLTTWPFSATWLSTRCRRTVRKARCVASSNGPAGTTPISPACWPILKCDCPGYADAVGCVRVIEVHAHMPARGSIVSWDGRSDDPASPWEVVGADVIQLWFSGGGLYRGGRPTADQVKASEYRLRPPFAAAWGSNSIALQAVSHLCQRHAASHELADPRCDGLSVTDRPQLQGLVADVGWRGFAGHASVYHIAACRLRLASSRA